MFVPGGSICKFKPYVSMSQNLLPFMLREAKRYGFSKTFFRLIILRFTQSFSFKNANGIIFLSEFANKIIKKQIGDSKKNFKIIPHGISERFRMKPFINREFTQSDREAILKILYVSIIDVYKHQWHLIKALSQLRGKGFHLELHLVGPCNPSCKKLILKYLDKYDPKREWVVVHGPISYENLHYLYQSVDIGVYSSTCENLPNTLIEPMAAGLPIACSKFSPMKEIVSKDSIFYDPENPDDIELALKKLIEDNMLRESLSKITKKTINLIPASKFI